MPIQMQLGDDHDVLSKDPFCSGYVDSFGKWNNGFACPKLESEPVFCCGTSTYRYCCTTRDEIDPSVFSERTPLILGVVFGTLVTVVLVITAVCLFWRSYHTNTKRRTGDGGLLYRLPSSSTTSGVANMYSYSSASLGRRVDPEDVLQDVDEVAVTRPGRITTVHTIPRTFTAERCSRVSFAESIGDSSVSTSTENERHLFIEPSSGLPPPYKLDGEVHLHPEEARVARIVPFPQSFSSSAGLSDSGHYQVPRSPVADDSLYHSTKF